MKNRSQIIGSLRLRHCNGACSRRDLRGGGARPRESRHRYLIDATNAEEVLREWR